nr:SpoIIE family protein phosphatase [uncultured Faecalimonas sp.]
MEKVGMGQAGIAGPYAVQIGKLADSLEHLSKVCLKLEQPKQVFTKDELQEMFFQVEESVCTKCDHMERCWGDDYVHTCQLGYEILHAVEEYGKELNIETKRKLQKKCVMAPKFQSALIEVFHEAKQNMLWANRLVKNREGCAVQLDLFAQIIKSTAKEFEDSILIDARMEKKLRKRLQKIGVKVLDLTFLRTERGKHEIHLNAKAVQEMGVETEEMLKIISRTYGKRFVFEEQCRRMLAKEYEPYVCMEPCQFHILQGVAKIGKGRDTVSGDSFLEVMMPGGRAASALSDGMGSGRKAFQESAMVAELLEDLLTSGFPGELAIQMINTALVMGREEIHFSTVDMSIFDLYTGECEFLKVGASTTFIKYRDRVERLSSTSLPIGVLHNLEIDMVKRTLRSGEFVVMMTDGVLDALPVVEQELLMETIIGGMRLVNPKEMAQYILDQVLIFTGETPKDDMTVLVAGIWKGK